MKTLLEKLLKFLGLLVLIIIVSLIPELIGGNIAEYLEGKLGEHYFWILAGTGLVALLFVTLWTEGDKIFNKKKGEPTAEVVSEDNLQKIRTGLLESYQERLKSKLAARFPINLELKYSTEGANVRQDILDNKNIRSTKIKEELIHLFDKHRGRLLIIGEPGAGKTTLLLQLAEQLMEREEKQIPVVINMATWRERFSSVEEWLQELLPQMGFSKSLATQFLKDDVLLPLFDGLDELDEDLRRPCLEAIGEYGKKQDLRYVICSRIVEYAQTVDAPVYCQIMVKPLTITQIKEGLQEANSPETNGILDAMKKDPLLREGIKTPFYLNTVQLLFASSKVWEEFDFKAETVEGRQKEILEFFVAYATSGFEKYSSDQVKKYLGFLADRMTWKGLVEFELVDLQYDWIRLDKKQAVTSRILDGVIIAMGYLLLFVLIVMLGLGFIGKASLGFMALVWGFSMVLVSGLGFGLIEILPKENRYRIINFFDKNIIIDLVYGQFAGLISGLILGGTIGLALGWLAGLTVGLAAVLLGGLAGCLVGGQNEGMFVDPVRIKTKEIMIWSFSYFKKEMKKTLVFGLLAGLAFGLISGIFLKPIGGMIAASLIGGLIFALITGLINQFDNTQSYLKIQYPYQRFSASIFALQFSIFQHHHLKRVLLEEGFLPKGLVFFLKAATKQNLLESDGGSWRFRHRILQEYFAGHWAAVYGAEDTGHPARKRKE